LARLMTRDDQKQMLQIYDAIHVHQDHASVHLHADFTAEQADQLMQAVHVRAGEWPLQR
jgi:hypothetical protein